MQQSACPECGATIGGNDHRVDRANRVDETMENLAQRVIAEASPWRFNDDL